MKYIRQFKDILVKDKNLIGLRGISQGYLKQNDFLIPAGFVITKELFDDFFEKTGLKRRILNELMNSSDPVFLSENICRLINETDFHLDMIDPIIEAYDALGFDNDSNDAGSFLKNQEALVNIFLSGCTMDVDQIIYGIKSGKALLDGIKRCYCVLFSPESISKMMKDKGVVDISDAIIVQKMFDVNKSGRAYNVGDYVIIEAVFGIDVDDSVQYDKYLVKKENLKLEQVKVADKSFKNVVNMKSGEIFRQKLNEKSRDQVLYEQDIYEIARLTKKVELKFGTNQMIRWAIVSGMHYIIRSDPVDASIEFKKDEEEDISDTSELIDVYENPDIDEELKALDEINMIGSENNEEICFVDEEEGSGVPEELINKTDEGSEVEGVSDQNVSLSGVLSGAETDNENQYLPNTESFVEESIIQDESIDDVKKDISEDEEKYGQAEDEIEIMIKRDSILIEDSGQNESAERKDLLSSSSDENYVSDKDWVFNKQEEIIGNDHVDSKDVLNDKDMQEQNDQDDGVEEGIVEFDVIQYEIDDNSETEESDTDDELVSEQDLIHVGDSGIEEEQSGFLADDSIFSSYKGNVEVPEIDEGLQEENETVSLSEGPSPKDLLDSVFYNSGNIIVGCDMVITLYLKKLYKVTFNKDMTDEKRCMEELLRSHKIGKIDEIRQIRNLKEKYLSGSYVPSELEVALALRAAKEIVK